MENKKKKSVGKIITSVIVYSIFAIVVIMLLYVFISLLMGVQPSLFGYKMYYVLTPSMQGTIDEKDVIFTKEIKDKSTLKKGDIVTFIAPEGFVPSQIVGQYITHRIERGPFEGKDGKIYIETKGDANPIPDAAYVPIENVEGKFVKKSVVLAGLLGFLRHWYGFVTLIIVPLVIVLIIEIVRIIKLKSQQKEIEFNDKKQKDIDEAVAKALEEAKAIKANSETKGEDLDERE